MGIFNFFKKTITTATNIINPSEYYLIVEEANEEFLKSGKHYWELNANSLTSFNERIQKFTDKQKVEFILEAILRIHEFHKATKSYSSNDKNYQITTIWDSFLRHLLRTKLLLDDEDIQKIAESFSTHNRYSHTNILNWPIITFINNVEKNVNQGSPSPTLISIVSNFKEVIQKTKSSTYDLKDKVKAIEKLDNILFGINNETESVKPTWFPGTDQFAEFANNSIKGANEQAWFKLMHLSKRGTGSIPSSKYVAESRALIKELGDEVFKQKMNDWFKFIVSLKEITTEHTNHYQGREYHYTTTEFLDTTNTDMIKGFIWMCTPFHNKTTLLHIASLAERVYKKIPGKGPAAPGIGNACLYVLANVRGMDGVGHLSRLRLRIKQNNTQTLIEKYLNQAAKEQGVSIHEIEDMAVDDFDLTNAQRSWELEGFTAKLSIVGVGKTDLQWYKSDGNLQKTVPSVVKDKQAIKLKKIKEIAKQAEITITAQRDRIDRFLKADRQFTWQQFTEFYFEHGLMCFLTHKLVWIFEQGDQKQAVIYIDNKWQHPKGELSFVPDEATKVKLWHPAFESLETIQNWRQFLIDAQIVQPLKQVFREVYLLTDAEINTRTYSNRMAAHILKQHQFNSLAKSRGWKYSLLGCYDDGRENETASLILPEVGLRAEYWINEVNADDAFNETGIWHYVATDQVRFVNIETNEIVELIEVPALVFSEVMRDVDLFVGVASVGNDPTWRDNGGLLAYRDYWQSYSFGELTEVAKTRKTILERLVPRLKIASQCEIRDKFLVVKGKLRTYKIHIGSTNILMEPNDQYLCIVPDRSAGTASTDKLFLPFEGDNGISVIISKALLLANDTAITDTTITSQINRK